MAFLIIKIKVKEFEASIMFNDNWMIKRNTMKQVRIFAISLILFFMILITVSCSNNQDEVDKDCFTYSLMELGFQNCLVCHTGGLNPIGDHCKSIDPVSYFIMDSNYYSPKVSNCSLCHISGEIEGHLNRTSMNCSICHHEYLSRIR